MLSGLTGVLRKEVKCEFFGSVTKGLQLLKKDKAATAAGDNGAINIYIDDEGVYRGYRYAYCSTKSFIVTMKINELAFWLKREFPKIK